MNLNTSMPRAKYKINMTIEMTGAEILVRSLQDLKVTHVFSYPGATILPVFHALAKTSMRIVVNSNEQSCAFSAAGYSRSSDKVGVAVVTSGPAITNTLTAVADSNADSVPILVFAGQGARASSRILCSLSSFLMQARPT